MDGATWVVHHQPMEMGSMDAKVNDHIIPEGGGGQLFFFAFPPVPRGLENKILPRFQVKQNQRCVGALMP